MPIVHLNDHKVEHVPARQKKGSIMKHVSIALVVMSTLLGCQTATQLSQRLACPDNSTFACAHSIKLDTTYTGAVVFGGPSNTGKFQYMRVHVSGSGVVEVFADPVPPSMTTTVALFNDRQARIKDEATYEKGKAVYLFQAVDPGWYYAGVRFHTYDRSSRPSEPFSVGVYLDTTDVYEVNDTFAQARSIELDAVITATIKPAQDVDSYSFEVLEPGRYQIALSQVAAENTMSIALFNKRQETMAATPRIGAQKGQAVSLEHEIKQAGLYYVVFRDAVGYDTRAWSETPYQFSIVKMSAENDD